MITDPATYRIGPDGSVRPWIDVTTLGDLLDRQAQLTPEVTALVLPNDRATYRQLAATYRHAACRQLAAICRQLAACLP